MLRELTGLTSADINDFTTLIKENNSNHNQEPADVITLHLSSAQDIGDKLTSSVIAQDELLKEILIGNDNFISARKSDPVTVKRDAMVCYDMIHVLFFAVFNSFNLQFSKKCVLREKKIIILISCSMFYFVCFIFFYIMLFRSLSIFRAITHLFIVNHSFASQGHFILTHSMIILL